jgi:NitT/TauT family transport system substrate-binding protein
MSIAVGLDPTKVRKVVTGIGLTGLPLLMRGDVDGFFVFYESKTALERDRAPLHYLPGDDFAPMPGDALITGRAFAEDPRNEQAIVRFLRAARRGVEYMQDERNFDDIVSVLKAYNPIEAQDAEKGRRILSVLRGYMQPPAGMKRLRMDEAAWARCIELLEKIDVIKKKGVPHARFFTNRFVDQA